MTIKLLTEARDAAGLATPLTTDCGRLCRQACCAPDGDGQGGVYLFPGEEAFYAGADWTRIEDAVMLDRPVKILYCRGLCPRDNRPLGCRIFPLTPAFSPEGQLRVRFDFRARPLCPLARSGLRGLSPAFTQGVRQALRLIDAQPDGHSFLLAWEAMEKQYDFRL